MTAHLTGPKPKGIGEPVVAQRAPAHCATGKEKNTVKAQDLTHFQDVLLRKRDLLSGNVNSLEAQALKRSRQDASGDLSTMPIHMADIGSDNFEQEFTLGLIENEEEMLRAIDEALQRIEDGTFGKCEECGKPIRKTRLKAIPHARLCIKCQREEELNQ